MADFMAYLLSIIAILTALLAFGWFFFGYIDVMHNWMHRRDLNRNVRKDTHIQFVSTVDEIMKDINTNGKITNDEEVVKFISLVQSAAGSIKSRRIKKRYFDKKIILDQVKYIVNDGLDENFYLNKKVKINDVLKLKKFDDVKKLTIADSQKLIILIATAAFTEQVPVIRYDKKFEVIVDSIYNIKKIPKKILIKI